MAYYIIKLKDGKEYSGEINKWRPYLNWFSIFSSEGDNKFCFDNIKEAYSNEERISINSPPEGERVDLLERAREDLKLAREHGWYLNDGFTKDTPLFDWEK